METNPTVTVKRKNIQTVIDYCLDSKVEFTVKHKKTNDEFDVEFIIENITRAIAFGMFLRENRMTINGLEPATPAPAAKGRKTTAVEAKEKAQPTAEETIAGMAFEEKDLQLDLAN